MEGMRLLRVRHDVLKQQLVPNGYKRLPIMVRDDVLKQMLVPNGYKRSLMVTNGFRVAILKKIGYWKKVMLLISQIKRWTKKFIPRHI